MTMAVHQQVDTIKVSCERAYRSTEDVCSLSAVEMAGLYRRRELSPVEVMKATLARIDSLNPILNAFVSIEHKSAMAQARAAEALFMAGLDLGPLQGVPFSVKDMMKAKGTRTTAASRVLRDAPIDREDAYAVHRLRTGGAILVGKTNLHEFAIGVPDADSPFGKVQNPRRLGHQPGGSSSGSAAAVAAGLGVVSLGTDTGGSARGPATLCGIVGLKATYGLVSLGGVIPLSTQLDQVGLLGRSVADVAVSLEVLAGHDPNDPTSSPRSRESYLNGLGCNLEGLRIGVASNPCYRLCLQDALTVHDTARDRLVAMGAKVTPILINRAEEVADLWELIMLVDLAAYHRRIGADENLYGRPIRERLEAGHRITGVEYAASLAAKAEIRRIWLDVFEQVDLILLPGNGAGAPRHGVDTLEIEGRTYPANLIWAPANRVSSVTGLPAIVVPVGEDSNGMPIGIQLVGCPFGERRLLAVAEAIEIASGNLARRWGISPRNDTVS